MAAWKGGHHSILLIPYLKHLLLHHTHFITMTHLTLETFTKTAADLCHLFPVEPIKEQ